jgi:propanol-preferring alcohol dehydrogenase
MRAMMLNRPGSGDLEPVELETPVPGPGQVLIKVAACGVCRTDLHLVDGELPDPLIPVVPGHEIVGKITAVGDGVAEHRTGDRVGVPWLGGSCGICRYCETGRENLCAEARYTGYQINGGYAEYTVADARYTFRIPDFYTDIEAAPLLCAGLIGYRSYRMALEGAGDVARIGLYGFGAAAHIIAQVATHQGRRVYAFTKEGDQDGQSFARELGAVWAGGSTEAPPQELDAAILFAPVGGLVPLALQAVGKGGSVICAGIHMSDIPSFPYRVLWEERTVRSVANLTRRDAVEFLELAPQVPVRTHVHEYPLESANQALDDLRNGRFHGAAVLTLT